MYDAITDSNKAGNILETLLNGAFIYLSGTITTIALQAGKSRDRVPIRLIF
jgi:hypothetical protein